MSGILKNRDNPCARGLAISLFLFGSSIGAIAADFNLPSAPTVSLIHGSSSTAVIYSGKTNFQYALYGSSNLVVWTGLTTNLCVSPQMTFSESNRLTRFFKATSSKTPLTYQCTLSGSDSGDFMVFVRTNDTFAMIGTTTLSPGEYANSLPISSDNRYYGPLLTGRTGLLAFTDRAVSGSLSNLASRTGAIVGALKANAGPFQTSAGIYSGTFSGACTGTVVAIVSADGTIYLYATDPRGPDAGSTVINGTSFTVATPRGTHYTGTLTVSLHRIGGTILHACDGVSGFGNFTMNRTEKVFF